MRRVLFIISLITFFCCSSKAQLNMLFRSQISYGASNELSNIGGFVDTLGNEYALVGMQTGLAIVDVTNPAAPVQKFLVAGANSFWREVKVWGRYAYVTTEACCNGLQIIDLRNLPASVNSKYWTGTGAVSGLVRRIHSLHIDNGYLYLNGPSTSTARLNDGACLIVSLADPWNPVYMSNTVLGFAGSNRYVHDCFVRNDTLWAAHIYGGFFSVINVANKSAPSLIATQSTPGAFTHNTWLNTSGARTLFTTDEVSNSFLSSYDVTNLGNITLLDKVQLNPGSLAIVHNTHIRNNYAIVSWYKEGIAIVDVSRPDNLIITGYYDTYQQGSGNGFNGCWGVYPFLPSGNIVASDINNGLFVLTPTYIRGCYLEGTVRDACSNIALPNVSVSIVGTTISKTSKLTGEYRTGTAVAGTYTVTFSKTGYQPKTISGVSLNNGVLNTMNVLLNPINSVSLGAPVISNVTCHGNSNGAINASATSGPLPHNWLWSTGATTEDVSTLAAGNYTVTVTDGAGCSASSVYAVSEPAPLQVSFTSLPISCSSAGDGQITATVSGGTSPYSFIWSYPSPSRVASMDNRKSSNTSSPQLASDSTTIANLFSGNYALYVVDSNGCYNTFQYNLSTPSNPCNVWINLKLFIQGFYQSPTQMSAVIDPTGAPGTTDAILVELHANQPPFAIAFSATGFLDTSGSCQVVFPGLAWANIYYLVVKHRNSLATWSKFPITIAETNFFNFSSSTVPAIRNQTQQLE